MRTSLGVSGAGGSGVLVARQEDGSWSPPSGILVQPAGLDFLFGINIYDCVVAINSWKTLELFTKIRALPLGRSNLNQHRASLPLAESNYAH
jgi:lipid-binding SYLF domain-containing protein